MEACRVSHEIYFVHIISMSGKDRLYYNNISNSGWSEDVCTFSISFWSSIFYVRVVEKWRKYAQCYVA